MMKTREQVITDMCYTWRHDYGLHRSDTMFIGLSSPGMTNEERKALWQQMAQVFDNNITPYMEFKK